MLNKFEFDQQYVENHGASGRSFFGNCNDNMCNNKVILDTDNFQHSTFGIEIFIHEYGHILDFLIMNQKNNWNFNSKQHIISSLAADTKITNEAYQKILAYGIIRSSYGRDASSTEFELFAEAFVRWLLTPQQNRDLGWEKLDKYFRIDLVKKLSSGQ